jgi:hypothetical protein
MIKEKEKEVLWSKKFLILSLRRKTLKMQYLASIG